MAPLPEDTAEQLLGLASERGLDVSCVGSSLSIQGPWWLTDLALQLGPHEPAIVAAWYRRAVAQHDPRLFTGEEYDRLRSVKRRLVPFGPADLRR